MAIKKVEAWEGPNGTLHLTRVQALQAFAYENYLEWLTDQKIMQTIREEAFVGLSKLETYKWLYNHLEELQKVLRP